MGDSVLAKNLSVLRNGIAPKVDVVSNFRTLLIEERDLVFPDLGTDRGEIDLQALTSGLVGIPGPRHTRGGGLGPLAEVVGAGVGPLIQAPASNCEGLERGKGGPCLGTERSRRERRTGSERAVGSGVPLFGLGLFGVPRRRSARGRPR